MRPQPRISNASPVITSDSSSRTNATQPAVWPGTARTLKKRDPNLIRSPCVKVASAAAPLEAEIMVFAVSAFHSGRALIKPVPVMWSACAWVLMAATRVRFRSRTTCMSRSTCTHMDRAWKWAHLRSYRLYFCMHSTMQSREKKF